MESRPDGSGRLADRCGEVRENIANFFQPRSHERGHGD